MSSRIEELLETLIEKLDNHHQEMLAKLDDIHQEQLRKLRDIEMSVDEGSPLEAVSSSIEAISSSIEHVQMALNVRYPMSFADQLLRAVQDLS